MPAISTVATPAVHMKHRASCRRKIRSTFRVGSGRMYAGSITIDEAWRCTKSRNVGTDPRERRQNQEPDHGKNRNHERLAEINQDVPGRLRGQRQVFAILLRAKMLSHVVIDMRVIHEGRHQKRNADQQVPHDAKHAKRIAAHMYQLVREQHRPVVQQAANDEHHDLFDRIRRSTRRTRPKQAMAPMVESRKSAQ